MGRFRNGRFGVSNGDSRRSFWTIVNGGRRPQTLGGPAFDPNRGHPAIAAVGRVAPIWLIRAAPETGHSFSLPTAADPPRLRSILIGSGPLLLTHSGHAVSKGAALAHAKVALESFSALKRYQSVLQRCDTPAPGRLRRGMTRKNRRCCKSAAAYGSCRPRGRISPAARRQRV